MMASLRAAHVAIEDESLETGLGRGGCWDFHIPPAFCFSIPIYLIVGGGDLAVHCVEIL